MTKLDRNTVAKREPIYHKSTKSKIDWNHIKQLNEKQEIEGLHVVNKLTKPQPEVVISFTL